MKTFLAYIRVSTAKQGEQGVSLAEQRDSITRYALRNGLEIASWYEERETAAKRGRPVFLEMLKLLRAGKAAGVIIHKIDRSARNMKDWAEIGELIDAGIDVRFTNEGLDLSTRGGRLSADIQAVVAADFIRNLREETKKGFYGRLKQGLYPMPAPIGYLDRGKGQLKAVDPVKGPLVRKAFELYGSGGWSLDTLTVEMHRLGLRNRNGGTVPRNSLSKVLNNPFYFGMVRLRHSGETFPGSHEPLISKALFEQVHDVLHGKIRNRGLTHDLLFRRLLECQTCGYSLIGELQKGHAYYRCHRRECPTTSVREDAVESAVFRTLEPLQFNDSERSYMAAKVTQLREGWLKDREQQEENFRLRLDRLRDRLTRLTDAFLDGTIAKGLFEEHKEALLSERIDLEHRLIELKDGRLSLPSQIADFLELAGNAYLSYKLGLPEEKRDLLRTLTSNRAVDGKNVQLMLLPPFLEVANRLQNVNGSPHRSTHRTLDKLLAALGKWFSLHPEVHFGGPKKDNKVSGFGKGEEVAAQARANVIEVLR